MALRAQRTDVPGLILRQVSAITTGGVALGLPAAFAAPRLVRATLYGVEPGDPESYAPAAVVMTIVAGFAGFVPARRAAGAGSAQSRCGASDV